MSMTRRSAWVRVGRRRRRRRRTRWCIERRRGDAAGMKLAVVFEMGKRGRGNDLLKEEVTEREEECVSVMIVLK